MAWAKNNLKTYGLLENSSRGIWSLTEQGKETKTINEISIIKSVQEKNLKKKYGFKNTSNENFEERNILDLENSEIIEINWEDELLEIIKNITPEAFE